MSHPHDMKTEPDHDDDHSDDHNSINRNSFDGSENKSNNQGGGGQNNPFLGMAAASLMDASAAKGMYQFHENFITYEIFREIDFSHKSFEN